MRLFSYLYQLKLNFISHCYSSKNIYTKHEKNERTQQNELGLNGNIKHKCEVAAQKVQCINNFTHWPITKPKRKTAVIKKNTLISLCINHKKTVHFKPEYYIHNINVEGINKQKPVNNGAVIRKLH